MRARHGAARAGAPAPTGDEADFTAASPHLPAVASRWLADALDVCHPGHPWRLALTAARP